MSSYWANPQTDLPAPWKAKAIIFYAQGLKVYGQIPYILQQRLQAEFYSNNAGLWGGRLCAPSFERNYTVVPYRRKDGNPHRQEIIKALLDWLYADKGFEWAIAKDFHRKIDLPNFYNWPPDIWEMGKPEQRSEFAKLLLDSPKEKERCKMLDGPKHSPTS